MKTQTILIIFFALLIGLLGGYLLFGGNPTETPPHDHAMEGEQADASVWTCSMHPQIQRDEPGDCPICGMDLIPLANAASSDPTVLTMSEAAVALARVRTSVVGAGEGKGALQLTGRLATNEASSAVQSVNYGGRLERLLITFPGEQVRAGQRIATIYSPDLVVAQEELLAARKLRALSPELFTAARNKLRYLKISEDQIAELESSGEVITDFPVYAERGGTVLDIRARVGDYVQTGATLYTLTDLSKLWALFDAYERNLAAVRVGDLVTFSVASLPEETFTARVSFIDPLIDPATRTASIRAEVSNRGGRLKPEMFVTGKLEPSARAPSSRGGAEADLAVPKTAVLWTGERSVVYVATPDSEVPTYQFREVTLGPSTGTSYRVIAGLEAGERVVTNGAFSIDAAAQLRNQSSMMNRGVSVRGRDPEEFTALVLPNYQKETPDAFRDQLDEVVAAYLSLKNRMVSSQIANNTITNPITQALARVDMSLLKEAPHLYWMEQLGALQSHLAALIAEDDLGEQRRQFGFLSQALINTLTVFGAGEQLLVQHCPMAFSGEGANWISRQAAILNPYYGDAMLTCGSTIDTLSR